MSEHNPQAEQMGDESMARNLGYQAQAIWPQEEALFDRYRLSGPIRILDLGCGTGEITRRLALRYAGAQLLGVDILDSNLQIARRGGDADGRIQYRVADAFALDVPEAPFDLVVCRHMSQAVPRFALVLEQICRVLKPGGWLHLLSEDYGMLHMPRQARDPDAFWQGTVLPYLESLGCDGRIGRHSVPLLLQHGFSAVAIDYVTVDTLRARDPFAGIISAWRDGYVDVLAQASGRPPDEVRADFDAIIASIRDPAGYAVWHVPVISGQWPPTER
ncbi:class I SAM-dependent methyltransferase [Tahibacter amnicola]|uniref:Methyltransferase domain-containing protein n=1 Tax=Tahibacter amnicola TaxID=2976241 RepID=A0ABY6BE56_9GAMM|nr:class I SAM-dependent methyltransferase [Tahibacter amnicola]UXI67528.1 methyltransferase domain-containing protein [Tahibacter amnicola]